MATREKIVVESKVRKKKPVKVVIEEEVPPHVRMLINAVIRLSRDSRFPTSMLAVKHIHFQPDPSTDGIMTRWEVGSVNPKKYWTKFRSEELR